MIALPSNNNRLQIAPDAAIDLQLHTIYSDGTWLPEQLIDYLISEQFALAAITDHDRVDSVASIQQLGAQKGLPILAAVEMSASWRGGLTDVLCYGFAPEPNELCELGQSIIRRQQEITQEVYLEVQRKGYAFPYEEEVLQRKSGDQPLQPNELQQLLLQHGYSRGPGSIGQIIVEAGFYFATNSIAEVIAAAHNCGAVCLIAHPGRGDDFTLYDAVLLDELRHEVPIDGIEAYYPVHNPEQIAMYLRYAQKHNLLVSSGSDSHGPEKKPVKYRADFSRQLLERVGIEVSGQG